MCPRSIRAARGAPYAPLALLALLAALSPARAAAQTIDTRTAESWVDATTLRFGQTFTVPAGATRLHHYAFFLALGAGDAGDATFRTVLQRWDGTRPTGPTLAISDVRAATCCTPVEERHVVGALPVVAGDVYVAIVESLSGLVAHARPADGFGGEADSYAGGGAVLRLCPPDEPACDTWGETGADRAFVARFSGSTVVPEPATGSLLAAGVLALVAAGVRRRERRPPAA